MVRQYHLCLVEVLAAIRTSLSRRLFSSTKRVAFGLEPFLVYLEMRQECHPPGGSNRRVGRPFHGNAYNLSVGVTRADSLADAHQSCLKFCRTRLVTDVQ